MASLHLLLVLDGVVLLEVLLKTAFVLELLATDVHEAVVDGSIGLLSYARGPYLILVDQHVLLKIGSTAELLMADLADVGFLS